MTRYISLIVVAVLVLSAACSGPVESVEADTENTDYFSTPEAFVPALELKPVDSDPVEEPEEEYVPPPPTTSIGGYEIPLIEVMGVEELTGLVGRFREEDPYREYFTADGRFRVDCGYGYYSGAHDRGVYDCIVDVLRGNRYLEDLFLKAPVLVRRGLLGNLPPTLGEYLVEYLHPDYVFEWVTDLDWDRDIEPLDPDKWLETEWEPNDGLTTVEGYHEEVSRTDYWVRMFWRRRGEAVFSAVKSLVEGANSVP